MTNVNTILLFNFFASNPIIRNFLKSINQYCEIDDKNRLEVCLELYTGVRKNSCFKCKIYYRFVKYFIKIASHAFGAKEDEIKERFKDKYWRRGLVSVIKGIAYFGVSKPFTPGAPFQIVWNITRRCNLRCKHCYEDAGKKDFELDTKDAKRAIDILAKSGVVILAFSGGEPLVREDIFELIRYASDKGIYTAIATNGTLLTKETTKKLKESGLGFVQISLDGMKEFHEEFRGVKGIYEKVIEGIKNSVEEGFFTEIATTVTKMNIDQIPKIIDLAEKLKANWVMLYNFIPVGRGRDIITVDLEPDEREFLLKYAFEETLKRNVDILSTAPQYARVALQCANEGIIPTHFYNPNLKGRLKSLAEFIGGCGAGRFYLAMEPNGDIYPCVFFPRVEKYRIGNILEDDFEELWLNNEILKQLRNKDILKGNCGKCSYRYYCGGCRARAANYFDDHLSPDPGCINNKLYWNKIKNSILVKIT